MKTRKCKQTKRSYQGTPLFQGATITVGNGGSAKRLWEESKKKEKRTMTAVVAAISVRMFSILTGNATTIVYNSRKE